MDMVDIDMANKTAAMTPMQGFDFQKSVTSMDGMNGAIYPEGFASVQRDGTWGTLNQQHGSGYYSEFDKESGEAGIYDGMTLPDHILRQYYTQVKKKVLLY